LSSSPPAQKATACEDQTVAGMSSPIKIAMMAMTTSSPMSVNVLVINIGSLSVVGSAGGYWHTNTKTVVLDLDGFGLGPAINGVEFFDGQFVMGPVVAVAHDLSPFVLGYRILPTTVLFASFNRRNTSDLGSGR
jgi:hypothetical protein